MKDSTLELKMRLAEEIEFELMVAMKTDNQSLVPGLERALSIIEETE
jgi:hypothetical protein